MSKCPRCGLVIQPDDPPFYHVNCDEQETWQDSPPVELTLAEREAKAARLLAFEEKNNPKPRLSPAELEQNILAFTQELVRKARG